MLTTDNTNVPDIDLLVVWLHIKCHSSENAYNIDTINYKEICSLDIDRGSCTCENGKSFCF